MHKKLSAFLKYSFFLLLGVFLVWWSLQQIPANEMQSFRKAFTNVHYELILPVFLILSSSHVFRAIRWRLLMQPLGYKPTFYNTFFAVMIGYLANLAVPRLGEVLKCTILSKYEGIPAEKLVGTIVTERAIDVVCLLLVFVTAFLLQYEIVFAFTEKYLLKPMQGANGNISTGKITLLITIVALVIGLLFFVLNKYKHLIIIQKIRKVIKGIWLGIVSIKNMQNPGLFVITTIAIWGLYVLGTYVGFKGTNGTDTLGISVAFTALAFGSVGMIITPGGIGSYALFLAIAMQENGIAYGLGYANGTIQWFAQFLVVLIVGFISMLLLPLFNKSKRENEKQPHSTQ